MNHDKVFEKKRNSRSSKVHWKNILLCVFGLTNVYQAWVISMYSMSGMIHQSSTESPSVRVGTAFQERKLLASNISNTPGWKPVYVYYGTEKLPDYNTRHWNSQVGQDEMVFKILGNKTNGYFIDLAANDAVSYSNTYTLERGYNWNGLCIEMSEIYWYHLAKRKCDVVGALVGQNNDEKVTVNLTNNALGGIKLGFKGGTTRRTASLKEVLQLFNAPKNIDYLSLDVEGAEELVMDAFPLTEYQFSVLTIERPTENLIHLLRRNGYTLVHYLAWWGESLWVHNSLGAAEIISKHGLNPKPPGRMQDGNWIDENGTVLVPKG